MRKIRIEKNSVFSKDIEIKKHSKKVTLRKNSGRHLPYFFKIFLLSGFDWIFWGKTDQIKSCRTFQVECNAVEELRDGQVDLLWVGTVVAKAENVPKN